MGSIWIPSRIALGKRSGPYVASWFVRAYMSPSRSKPLRSVRVLRRRNFCAKLRLLAWMSVGSRVQRKMHSLGCWASFSNYLNEGNRGVAFAPRPFFMPAWGNGKHKGLKIPRFGFPVRVWARAPIFKKETRCTLNLNKPFLIVLS